MPIDPNHPPVSFEVHQGAMTPNQLSAVAHWVINQGGLVLPLGATEAERHAKPLLPKSLPAKPIPPGLAAIETPLLEFEVPEETNWLMNKADFVYFAQINERTNQETVTALFNKLTKVIHLQALNKSARTLPRLTFLEVPDNLTELGVWDAVPADGLDVASFIVFTKAVIAKLNAHSTEAGRSQVYAMLGAQVSERTVKAWANLSASLGDLLLKYQK